MGNFIFTSPGVKFKERDLSFVTRNVGLTTAGLVGETLQGPAFEPVFVQSFTEFTDIFGGISNETFKNSDNELKYQLPFAAKSYLNASNQLWVTRVLGLSGYNAGKAWAITISGGLDKSTTGATTQTSSFTNKPFTNSEYMDVTVDLGKTYVVLSEFEKNGNIFEADYTEFIVTTMTGSSGTVSGTTTVYSGSTLTEYDDMVVAIVRSKGNVEDNPNAAPTLSWETEKLIVSRNSTVGNLYDKFTLVATKPSDPLNVAESYTVSLNPNSDYLPEIIGKSVNDKNDSRIWVQEIYPDLIKKLYYDDLGYSVNTELIECTTPNYSNYNVSFQTPETPWVVSQLKGNRVSKLFKFISISDGDAANKQIKISIENINLGNKTFNVVIRSFNDSDNQTQPLRIFTNCSLDKTSNYYIGKQIGTSDGIYPIKNNYVMVEIADNADITSFPAGFEGYSFNNFESSATGDNSTSGRQPKIFYNRKYDDVNNPTLVRKEYLGVSEKAYTTSSSAGVGINQNYFNYKGQNLVKTKGFHMDSQISGITNLNETFEWGYGKFQTTDDLKNPTNPYSIDNTRKFTLVPAGGFDGWDLYRNKRTNSNEYQKGGIYEILDGNGNSNNDFQAWDTAINTFSNPESVTINLLATLGINWAENSALVKNTINMVETERTDTLYVIDSPNIDIDFNVNDLSKTDVSAARNVTDLLELSDIDSNYSCTYFPWIQVNSLGSYVFIPPTGEVLKSIANTDKYDYPWFAVAGLNRGAITAIAPKYKLSQEARDILYKGRINPLAEFANVGTAIFGQKTLQVRESALDRINVRRLLLQIKVLISNIAIRLVFEQGDQTIMDQFTTQANPILDTIRRQRGLNDFRVKMDDSNNTPESMDRNELYGEIFLKPTRAVEYIGITFTITPSGASFEDFGA